MQILALVVLVIFLNTAYALALGAYLGSGAHASRCGRSEWRQPPSERRVWLFFCRRLPWLPALCYICGLAAAVLIIIAVF